MGEAAKELKRTKTVKNYRDLKVFQGAMDLTIEIFERSKRFPSEERFSLTDQCRRSSRSICANIGEAWRKRRAFISKLNDAEAEACETGIWIDIAFRCGYLTHEESLYFQDQCDHITAQLVRMIDQVEKWSFSK